MSKEALEIIASLCADKVLTQDEENVLRKALAKQSDSVEQSDSVGEPVAMRYDFDGYGYKYIDSGSGSDWQTRVKDAEPLYATPQQPKQEQGEPVAWLVQGWANGSMISHSLFHELDAAKKTASVFAEHYPTVHTIPLYTTPQQRKPLTDECCTWKQHDDTNMPDTWEADCGAMWTFTEGGPKANDMKFCPNCGKPTIEAAHGIKE